MMLMHCVVEHHGKCSSKTSGVPRFAITVPAQPPLGAGEGAQRRRALFSTNTEGIILHQPYCCLGPSVCRGPLQEGWWSPLSAALLLGIVCTICVNHSLPIYTSLFILLCWSVNFSVKKYFPFQDVRNSKDSTCVCWLPKSLNSPIHAPSEGLHA